MPFYAVAKGRTPGIFMTWGDCEAQVKGFSGARYKKFDTITSAQEFVNNGGGSGGGITKLNPNRNSYSQPNKKAATNNLKRSFSTSSNNQKQNNVTSSLSQYRRDPSKKPKARRRTSESDDDSDFSNISDDLTTIINKQMDDIEKRLKSTEKNIDKIVKQNTSKSSQKQTILLEPQVKKRKSNGNVDFESDADGYVLVYTDGACSANGTRGARAGLGVYWGDGHSLNTSEPVSGRATNNCGEIQAASVAIRQAIQNGVKKLAINTDSQFLINSVTKWIPGWKRKGWKLASGEPVKNEVDFKELDGLQSKIAIKWNYVKAHKGIHGNEMADQLAKEGASRYGK